MLCMMMAMINEPDQQELFRRIYRTHIDAMKACAWNIMHQFPDLTEDVLQEAFINILPHLDRIGSMPEDGARAYLLTVVKTAAIKILERNQMPHGHIVSFQELKEESVPCSTNVLDDICLNEEYQQLVQAIRELPQVYREILYLHYLGDMNLQEIASRFQVSYGTVRKRLQRGKVQLIRKMQEGGVHSYEIK